MKYALIFVLGILAAIVYEKSYASERCVRDSNGGICCWNVDEEGTIKPISCA